MILPFSVVQYVSCIKLLFSLMFYFPMCYNCHIFHCIVAPLYTATLFSSVPYKVHTRLSFFFTFDSLFRNSSYIYYLFSLPTFSVLYGIFLPRSNVTIPETLQLTSRFLQNVTLSLLTLTVKVFASFST